MKIKKIKKKKKTFLSCNCKSSECLKLYCDCFVNNTVCNNRCGCVGCKNHNNSWERTLKMEKILIKNQNAFKLNFNDFDGNNFKGLINFKKGCN